MIQTDTRLISSSLERNTGGRLEISQYYDDISKKPAMLRWNFSSRTMSEVLEIYWAFMQHSMGYLSRAMFGGWVNERHYDIQLLPAWMMGGLKVRF